MARKKFKQKENGIFQGHCECSLCGSSDAGAFYLHKDESYSFTCFSCNGSIPNFDVENMTPCKKSKPREIDWEVEKEIMQDISENLIAVSNKDRYLTDSIYDFYGCRMDLAEDGKKINVIYYPTYRVSQQGEYEHVGYRNRKRFKSWHKQVKKKPELLDVLKDFSGGVGDTKKGICLFGQWLFNPSEHKRVILCCGEEDAMTVYKMTSLFTKFDGGYPAVSTPSGENVEGIKPHIGYLSKFEEIYIVADQDKAGKAFEAEVCKILPVGKVRIVRLPEGFKDPSQMWTSSKTPERRKQLAKKFWNCLWGAEKYSPAGVMSLSEGWSQYTNRGKDVLIPFPESFGELNQKTHGGAALGEIVNIIAPSSVGKSSFVKEQLHSAIFNTDYNIGVLSLEETIDEFIEGMLSIHMSTQLNEISYDQRDREAEYKAFQEMIYYHPSYNQEDLNVEDRVERIHFLDHQGACDGDELLEKIDFLINGLDCKIIVLDPVTLACSGDTDEDEMASEIVKRTKRNKLLWINVHHVRKNSNGSQANSEGADLAEEDIKGSNSADTEFLTPYGWKRIDEYEDGDLVAEYCPKTKITKFVEPKAYSVLPCNEGFFHLKTTKGIDTMVSNDHTMYYQKQRSEELHSIKARELVEKHYSLSQGFRGRFETVSKGHSFSNKGLPLTDDELRLAVAYQADGFTRVSSTGRTGFSLKKERKIKRLKMLLNRAGIPYKEGGKVEEKETVDIYCNLPRTDKTFSGDWWEVTKEQAKVIYEECTKWDGHEGSFNAYFSNSKENCDYIQFIAMALGVRATVNREASPLDNKSKRTGNCYWCRFSLKADSTVSMTHKDGPIPIEKVEAEDGLKYCFVTSTGAWVSRRNGRIMMTGNTGAWFQVGMINLIFTRNKVHENPVVRNTTKIKMTKCRRHGKNTGVAGYIYYNGDTGRLELGQDPESILTSEAGFEDMDDKPINSFN